MGSVARSWIVGTWVALGGACGTTSSVERPDHDRRLRSVGAVGGARGDDETLRSRRGALQLHARELRRAARVVPNLRSRPRPRAATRPGRLRRARPAVGASTSRPTHKTRARGVHHGHRRRRGCGSGGRRRATAHPGVARHPANSAAASRASVRRSGRPRRRRHPPRHRPSRRSPPAACRCARSGPRRRRRPRAPRWLAFSLVQYKTAARARARRRGRPRIPPHRAWRPGAATRGR